MAHTCPDCGQVCHCNGDIDDILLDDLQHQNECFHFKECQWEYGEENCDPRTPNEM